MDEKQLAENIMKTVGSSLVSKEDYTLPGSKIAERYLEMLLKDGYDLSHFLDCILAIQHYVICAGYWEDKLNTVSQTTTYLKSTMKKLTEYQLKAIETLRDKCDELAKELA